MGAEEKMEDDHHIAGCAGRPWYVASKNSWEALGELGSVQSKDAMMQ